MDVQDRMRNIDTMLTQALRTAHETEDIGTEVLIELDGQHDQIKAISRKNEKIDGDLHRSHGILQRMYRTALQSKYLSWAFIVLLICAIVVLAATWK